MGVHSALSSFEDYQSQNKNSPILPNSLNELIIKSILKSWPLKRGSISAQYYPWNVYSSDADCVRFFTAFVLKCFFVLCEKDESKEILLLYKICENQHFSIYFWDLIKSNFDEIFLSKKKFKSNIPVILCLSDTILQTRNHSNQELALFEKFLEYLIRHGNGLVVFSQQKLCSSNSFIFHPSHSTEHFKNILKKQFKISVEEAFEPALFAKGSVAMKAQKDFSTGSFDRLLELLAIGQDFIFSIESAFKEKMKQQE